MEHRSVGLLNLALRGSFFCGAKGFVGIVAHSGVGGRSCVLDLLLATYMPFTTHFSKLDGVTVFASRLDPGLSPIAPNLGIVLHSEAVNE